MNAMGELADALAVERAARAALDNAPIREWREVGSDVRRRHDETCFDLAMAARRVLAEQDYPERVIVGQVAAARGTKLQSTFTNRDGGDSQ